MIMGSDRGSPLLFLFVPDIVVVVDLDFVIVESEPSLFNLLCFFAFSALLGLLD